MIEFLFEFIFEGIYEIVIELWTNHMKKKNPNYDNTRSKKVVIGIFKVIIIIIIFVFILGILLLIEWMFPDLLDIITFD